MGALLRQAELVRHTAFSPFNLSDCILLITHVIIPPVSHYAASSLTDFEAPKSLVYTAFNSPIIDSTGTVLSLLPG